LGLQMVHPLSSASGGPCWKSNFSAILWYMAGIQGRRGCIFAEEEEPQYPALVSMAMAMTRWSKILRLLVGSFPIRSIMLVRWHRVCHSKHGHKFFEHRLHLSFVRIEFPALVSDNLCSLSKKRAPCTRPDMGTMLRGRISSQLRC
jgi:hypothetical protein